MSNFNQCSRGHISKMIIIKKISSHFSKARFTNPNRPFQPRLTQSLPHEPFRVIRRKWLLIRRFHNRYTLTATVSKIISPSKPPMNPNRVNTRIQSLHDLVNKFFRPCKATGPAQNLNRPASIPLLCLPTRRGQTRG
ncbi:hypothetical protein HanPSC8_Chr12g0516111 [Helianthus annuus]|nr:hypothetical protein HanIR_Chr12g0577281 [Helianthus annuus]KAJ0862265.1 hypothetical protein HanPSC8_Chr12g0516111 [Helianthus annuus]